MARERIAITGIGANTSLGGALSVCAAVRARLARPRELPRMAFDAKEGPVPVVGHPVPTVAGFQGEARLLSLAIPALRELVSSTGLDSTAEVALCIGLPDLEARGRAAGTGGPKLRLLDRMVEYSGVRVPPQARQAIPTGHAGFALAYYCRAGFVGQGRIAACIAGGVDTLCDDLAIDALAAQERLKKGDNPVGLQPGEAAAFVLLESPDGVRRRRDKSWATSQESRQRRTQGPKTTLQWVRGLHWPLGGSWPNPSRSPPARRGFSLTGTAKRCGRMTGGTASSA